MFRLRGGHHSNGDLGNDFKTIWLYHVEQRQGQKKTIKHYKQAEGPTKTNLTLLFTPSNLGSQVVVEVQKSLAMVDSQLSVINDHDPEEPSNMVDSLLSVIIDHVNKL